MTNSPAAVITTSEYRILQGLKRLHTHSAEKLMEIGSQVKLECFLLPNIYKKEVIQRRTCGFILSRVTGWIN